MRDGQSGPVAHLNKSELLDALTILGIGYGEQDVDYVMRVKTQQSHLEHVLQNQSHAYHSALVRLIRRVLMNVYVNQTGCLPFDYDTDDSELYDEVNLLRPKAVIRRRLKRKRKTYVLAEGQPYRVGEGRSFIDRRPRDVVETLTDFIENGSSGLPSVENDVAVSDSELNGSRDADRSETGSDTAEDFAKRVEFLTEESNHSEASYGVPDPVLVTFGEYKVAATDDDPEDREADFRPVVCRVTVETGPKADPSFMDVCVDSGATFCLLSVEMYMKIKSSGFCSPLRSTRKRLQGASGTDLSLIGRTMLNFRLQGYECTAPVYVGNVIGVDLLLGVNWLRQVRALLDFGSMILYMNRTQVVHLRASKLVRICAGVYTISTPEDEDVSERYDGLIDGTIHGYVSVTKRHTIRPGTVSMVRCRITGRWEDGIDAEFSPLQNELARHVHLVESIDKPRRRRVDGNMVHTIDVCVANQSLTTFSIGKNTLLGRAEPLLRDQRPKCELGADGQRAGVYHLSIVSKRRKNSVARSEWFEEVLPVGGRRPKLEVESHSPVSTPGAQIPEVISPGFSSGNSYANRKVDDVAEEGDQSLIAKTQGLHANSGTVPCRATPMGIDQEAGRTEKEGSDPDPEGSSYLNLTPTITTPVSSRVDEGTAAQLIATRLESNVDVIHSNQRLGAESMSNEVP